MQHVAIATTFIAALTAAPAWLHTAHAQTQDSDNAASPSWTTSASTGFIATDVDVDGRTFSSDTWLYGVSASRTIGQAWSIGLSIDGFSSTSEAPDNPDTTASGLAGSVSAIWVGQASFVDVGLSVGAENQELAFRRSNNEFLIRDTDGSAFGAYIAGGYDVLTDGWRISPEAALYYDTAEFDGVTFESFGVTLGDSTFETLTTEVGVSAARRVGSVRPDVSAFVVYLTSEFDDGFGRRVTGRDRPQLATGEDEEVWVELGGGVTFDLTPSTGLRLGASASVARPDVDTARLTVSLSQDW